MRLLLVELTADEAANSVIVANIVKALDLKSVDSLITATPLSAAQVFGGAANSEAAPLAPAAPAAPSIAVAAPASTAPAAPTDGTPAAAVFGQLAAVATSAPAAPTAPAALTSPAGVALDRSGFPWDYRIHAEGKAQLKDGTWRQKRNTAPDLRAAVESELRANGFPAPAGVAAAPVAPVAPAAPAAPLAPAAPPAPPVTPQLTAEQHAQLEAARQQAAAAPVPAPFPATTFPAAPPAPAAPAAPAAPPVAVPPTGMTFGQLMLAVQDAQLGGKIPADWFASKRAAYGITTLPALMQHPDVVACIGSELLAIAPPVAVAA